MSGRTWDSYVREAAVDAFELTIGAEDVLRIACPTGAQLMRIGQGLRMGDMELILIGLTGEAWPRIEELMNSAPHGVLPKLVEDMMDHFHLYEEIDLIGPGGGRVKASRPKEIQALIRQGYKPVGEADASRG